jgi:outer membrane protein OmpA-like peptidoglycan-associated protein
MGKSKKESFFWTSYADLMTSLFFVMLVLFILVIVLLRNEMVKIGGERDATQEQLDKIREIEESVREIEGSGHFRYDEAFKRHTLRDIDVAFRINSSDINDIPQPERDRLLSAGHTIKNFVNEAANKNPEVKYLLIIEGQASRDRMSNRHHNFELSYRRALSLVDFWERNGLNFNDKNCEIIISGSGTESLFRVEGNESANQRFVIHIIPKIGEIELKN